jgi:hypothetical protein
LTSGVKATFEADMTNENTIAAVVATFPKLHTTLEKQYGKASGAIAATVGDDGANGEAGFWSSVLYTENHTDMVATVMAALKTNASPYTTEVWDGTWSGLRAYVGFKPAKKKTALMKLSAALKKAEKDILADELNAREAVFGIPDTDIVGIALFVAGLRGEIIADVIAAANNVLTTRKALAAMPVATDAELGIAA